MRKNESVLCIVQAQFIDYVRKNLNENNRIIFYNHVGHFGLEYAIRNYFKKAELISFNKLKTKTGKNLLFRLFHIIASVVAFILNERQKGDARTTITSILSNMENIYLGIDKEKEYLKYLHVKKIRHKKGKIRFVIRIEDNEIESDEDIGCLRLLCRLIEAGKINNTILLISGGKLNLLNLGIQNKNINTSLFQLDERDLNFIANRYNLKVTKSVCDNIELVKKLGLQFFIDNYNYFDALEENQKDKFDWIQKMDWIINQIIKKDKITEKQIYPLLEFSSFFEKHFSKIEIQNFKENQLEAENLYVAQKLALICQERSSAYIVPTYSFELDAFKHYFGVKYFSDLEPIPRFVFEYFREKYPFEYIPALKVLQADSSFIESKEKQSLIVTAYYYQNNERGISKCNDITPLITKDSTAFAIIKLYEFFKNRCKTESVEINILRITKALKNNFLDAIATCAGYVIVLQFLKENYINFPDISFSKILKDFMSVILTIESKDNYNKYWQVHFKCQYIALSLEDEDTNTRSARRFLDDVKKVREDENFSVYISENHLRGFTRVDLLAFSLAYDNAGDILKKLYNSAEESTILKELARINYSAYLIENELYSDAEKILKKGDANFIENINNDTYYGYLNNLYVAKWKTQKLNTKEYIVLLEELISKDMSYSDKLIIENNLGVGYFDEESNEVKGIEKFQEILADGNPYSRFLAIHNLLSYYFNKNDEKNFNNIYEQISIPKLLLSDKTFFLNKFKWMKDNIGKNNFGDFKNNPHITVCYNKQYLISSIERWFE